MWLVSGGGEALRRKSIKFSSARLGIGLGAGSSCIRSSSSLSIAYGSRTPRLTFLLGIMPSSTSSLSPKERSAGGVCKPFANLVFDLALVSISAVRELIDGAAVEFAMNDSAWVLARDARPGTSFESADSFADGALSGSIDKNGAMAWFTRLFPPAPLDGPCRIKSMS